MFGNNEYVGLAIQNDVVRVARLRVNGNSLKLIKLDQFSLVEKLKSEEHVHELEGGDDVDPFEDEDADSVFGFEEEDEEEDEEDIDFGDLEEEDEDISLDMVEESEAVQTNELQIYNILSDIDSDKMYLGLNVPAGHTIFQVIRDTDFNEVKKKDLIEDLEDKLESIYGMPKSKDNYSYEIRENGSLLLGSIDDESVTLDLINSAREFYSGKMVIQNVIPDELGLVGLVRANYELGPDEMTALIQFGKETCRVVFMKGEEVWLVSPVINEGTKDKSFLNTIFSKILFQLDTGEVPNLDRILLANNIIGEDAVDFFKDNFPDIEVDNLSLKPSLIDSQNVDPASIPAFTTAIGAALSASGAAEEHFPKISFLPQYIIDRQKIFKLKWHGILMLFLIFLTPITFNYFYTQNANQIEALSGELNQINTQIEKITPTVNNVNDIRENLATLKEKLVLLDTLSEGSKEWSVKFNLLNSGIQDVQSTWISSMSESEDGETFFQGYTLYRSRIPRIVNIFDDATLMSVNNEEMREQEIYSFSILTRKFAESDTVYSPTTPAEVDSLIGN